jgi:hypothetical protein
MGELLFKWKFNMFNPASWFKGNRYLSHSEIAGILNSCRIRPRNIVPDFRIYRMDYWKGVKVIRLPFGLNRQLQSQFADLSQFINLAEKVSPKIKRNMEGLVASQPGGNILNGIKLRIWGDTNDWEVSSVNVGYGPTGRTAGVVWFKSLNSGRMFKLGPGQLGTEQFVKGLMKNADHTIGMVAEVRSRGYEGRSAQFVRWHLDKGVG